MKIFLAGTVGYEALVRKYKPLYVLESFFYVRDWQKDLPMICKEFLLDSGAFTFMHSKKTCGEIDWAKYASDYADYIVRNNVRLFFELDIDAIVGYETVKALRQYIEQKTGRKSIPVWHRTRGLDEWKKLTREYDRIAIGGFAIKHIARTEYKYIPLLIRIAHENHCEVHGLGFTSMRFLQEIAFDSVDSTTWMSGSRFGEVHIFDGRKIVRHTSASLNTRIPKENVATVQDINFREWVKFQKHADKYM